MQEKNQLQAKTLTAIRPNAGIDAWYRRVLDRHVEAMQRSYTRWLSAAYRDAGMATDAAPRLALDALPAKTMLTQLRKLALQWQDAFDKMASRMGTQLTDRVTKYSDSQLDTSLRAKGFKVKFTNTPAMQDAYAAVAAEQVSLIKSIPSQYATEVQGLVMRSVARGRDLGYLTTELENRYGITRRRAATIARDQNNKATSTMTSARQQSLGIDEGVWKHSHAGNTPRPDHLAADGKVFSLSKGMYMPSEGKHVMPGEDINCRCTWQPIIPGFTP